MQNVSRIQRHPDTLIKNFCIAGLSQARLQDEIFPKDPKKDKKNLFNLDPDVLFSLYEEKNRVSSYLNQIFPDKVRILQTEKMVDPKFFTFMSVDENGLNQYNHVLIFYERFTENLIRGDFNQNMYIEILVKQAQNLGQDKNQQSQPKPSNPADESFTDFEPQDAQQKPHVFGQAGVQLKNEKKKMMVPLKKFQDETAQENLHQVQDKLKAIISDVRKTEILQRASQFKKAQPKLISAQSQPEAKFKQASLGQEQMATIAETGEENQPSIPKDASPYIGEANQDSEEDNYPENLYGKNKHEMTPIERRESAFYSKDEGIAVASETHDRAQKEISISHKQVHTDPNLLSQPIQEQSFSTRESQVDEKIMKNFASKKEYYFAPIAFILVSEVEHHDIFKEILKLLFKSISKPMKVTNNDFDNRELAFADFLSHLAFLSSIPCPTFNTRYHVEFFKKTLTFQEPNYDEIPDKNQLAIRVLFEMLDVRTIIYCWKAILFDRTLVLISSQYSLQFYIAQALLQLLFPLTFQLQYVQPASEQRLGFVGSPIPIIFCCSHLVAQFEYFEELGRGNESVAICDIDGSFTNNLLFPELEDEKRILRSLSALKNFKGARYDTAFFDKQELAQSGMQFTIEVRNVFFGVLDQFLNQLPGGEYFKRIEDPEVEKVWINYFDQEKYQEWFEGSGNEQFALELMNSQMFASFCDDFFDKDVSNMLIYLNITKNGRDFDASDLQDSKIKDAFERRLKNTEQELLKQVSQIEQQHYKNKDNMDSTGLGGQNRATNCDAIKEWPKFQKIDICWRIPQDNQRVMIYEKLEYAVQCLEQERKIKKRIQNQHSLSKVDLDKYQFELDRNHEKSMKQLSSQIQKIKKLYKQKLRAYESQIGKAKKDAYFNSQTQNQSSQVNTTTVGPNKVPGKMRRNQSQANPSSKDNEEIKGENLLSDQNSEGAANLKGCDDDDGMQDMSRDGTKTFTHLEEKEISDENTSDMVNMTVSSLKGPQQDVSPKHTKARTQNSSFPPPTLTVKATQDAAQLYQQMDEEFKEEFSLKEYFWQQRQKNAEHFSNHKIVDICYGQNGLIDFLQLLFAQFPDKKKVKSKFNFYFVMRKQLQSIEDQISTELKNTDLKNFLDSRKVLLCKQPSQSESLKVPEMKPTVSIIIKGLNGDICPIRNTWEMKDVNYNPLEVKQGGLEVFKHASADVWMLPVLPDKLELEPDSGKYFSKQEKLLAFRLSYQYISLKQKLFFAFEDQEEAIQLIFDEFLLFSQRDRQIFPIYRFYELLGLLSKPQKERIFSHIVARLPSSKFIFQLRLMFEHELEGMSADNDRPHSLDHQLFDRDFFVEKPKITALAQAKANQDSLNLLLDKKQQQSKNSPIVQGEMIVQDVSQSVTRHSQLHKNASASQVCVPHHRRGASGNTELSKQMKISAEVKAKIQRDAKNGNTKLVSNELGTTRQIKIQGSELTINSSIASQSMTTSSEQVRYDEKPKHLMASAAQQKVADEAILKSCKNFTLDQNAFNVRHAAKKECCQPDKIAKKLLLSLLDIYKIAFLPENFNEEMEMFTSKEVIRSLKQGLITLREYEENKFSSCIIVFENFLDSEENRQVMEQIKRCFWNNIFNFKILSKILEVLLVSPKTLNNLNNCTMFVSLMQSVKVRVNGELISCYEIFKTMLGHDNIHLLNGPFEENVRKREELPESVRSLAIVRELAEKTPCFLTSFAIYLPIKKWSDFTVYEKNNFQSQMRTVCHSINTKLNISPDNFLIRIPKFYLWKKTSSLPIESRLTTTASGMKTSDDDNVVLLEKLLALELISDVTTKDAIKTVLEQIKTENKDTGQSSHLFEIDNFWWKFDLHSLKNNIENYNNLREKKTEAR